MQQKEEAFISMPGYSGQVNDDQADTAGNWMSAKFKCKQHADNDTRTLDKLEIPRRGWWRWSQDG
ncbi:hypothetical protein QTG54_004504 [Skeletonema marinoi]|uniref:Uncharacterized protein n=1 Tax=Skeletonema marinoi TaxID=267567 RepID=A0AAD9DGX4_9STRA|nr:hypothetical protein QTG54_004504 [Skeletonema marinoi]